MARLLCLLWGHRIVATGASDNRVSIWCRRDDWAGYYVHFLGVYPANQRIDAGFDQRGDRWMTIGPLRRVYEYLSCQLLGHDEKWEQVHYLLLERIVCQTCGATRRVRDLIRYPVLLQGWDGTPEGLQLRSEDLKPVPSAVRL